MFLVRKFVFGRTESSELWVSDGTSEGTVKLASVAGPNYTVPFQDFTVGCGHLFFTVNDAHVGQEPWVYSFEDDDCDNVMQSIDNCPLTANSDQLDCDGDGLGNACDSVFMGDFDGNLVLDLADHRALTDCLGGPGRGPTPAIYGCEETCLATFDVDLDGSIDLREVAIFQALLLSP